MQLRILSTLLLVAEQTTVIVCYMVYLSAILTSCREFKTQPPDLSLCRANQILPYYPSAPSPLLHWLPVSFRNNFKTLLLTFKAIHELAPSYINELVKTQDMVTLRCNDGIVLSHPNFKTLTTLGDRRAFVASAPKLWNDSPLEIRMAKSVDTFKKMLKKHLFSISMPFYS